MSVGAGLGVGAACAPLNAPSVAIAPNSPAIFFSIFVSVIHRMHYPVLATSPGKIVPRDDL
jgi:hypothetical protein